MINFIIGFLSAIVFIVVILYFDNRRWDYLAEKECPKCYEEKVKAGKIIEA